MNDEELKDLFSAFEEVSASESLKSATLKSVLAASMAAAATTAPVATATAAVTADEVAVPKDSHAMHANPEGDQAVYAEFVAEPRAQAQMRMPEKPVFKATAGKARHKRAKRRTVRVAALAACFVLALSGGVAFATPTSYVTVSQGGTTIELGVNSFGFAVTATASDETGQKILDESTGLLNVPYQDSVSRVSDSLKKADPGASVDVDGNAESQGARSGSGSDSRGQKADMQSEQFGTPKDSMSSALVEYDWGGGNVPSMEIESAASASPSKSASATGASSSSSAASGTDDNAVERRISIDQVMSGTSEVVTQPPSIPSSNPSDSGDDPDSDQPSDSDDDPSDDSGNRSNGSSVRTSSIGADPDANDDKEADDAA